jgi:hypothetical protein
MKTTFLRGHINSLKACEIDTEDLGVLMTTILIAAKVSAEWHGKTDCVKVEILIFAIAHESSFRNFQL